jgi:iron complex outermembrane receptor protein
MRSAFASASRRITDQWEWSADGRYSSREFRLQFPQGAVPLTVPANNAFNHLGGPVLIAYDLTPDLGPVVDSGPEETLFLGTAVKGQLRGGWQLNLTGSYSNASTVFVEANTLNTDAVDAALNNADPAAALNIFGDGSHTNPVALAGLRSQNEIASFLDVFTTTGASVIADGPLVSEPAGAIRAAVGADYRKEHSVGFNIAGGPENRGREVYAGFFELAVPLIAARAGSTANRLELSLAGRYERYSDAGTTFNPTVGLSARPISQIKLRGTWGTAFRAPPFFYSNPDLMGDAAIDDVVDPRSPSGYSRALLVFGPKPDMKPETARSWTLGVDLTPPVAQNLSLSLTYFDIDYHDKIRNPGPLAALFLTQEAQFAPVITRNPTQAQIDAVCTKPPLYGGGCNQPIAVILDNGPRNLARVKTRGVDVALDFSDDTATGKWVCALDGTYMLVQEQQTTPSASLFNLLDTVGNPLELRLVGRLSWSHRGWTVQGTANYSGSYRDPSSVPPRQVDAWTTVDLNLGYDTHGEQGWPAHMQINLGIINLFDQRPPLVNQFDLHTGTVGYDPANANVMGRQVSLQLVKSWGK